jgi:hypothetical protein
LKSITGMSGIEGEMIDLICRMLLSYVVNALWQIPIIATTTVLCSKLIRWLPSGQRHLLWVIAMFLSVLLPVWSLRVVHDMTYVSGRAQASSKNAPVATDRALAAHSAIWSGVQHREWSISVIDPVSRIALVSTWHSSSIV